MPHGAVMKTTLRSKSGRIGSSCCRICAVIVKGPQESCNKAVSRA